MAISIPDMYSSYMSEIKREANRMLKQAYTDGRIDQEDARKLWMHIEDGRIPEGFSRMLRELEVQKAAAHRREKEKALQAVLSAPHMRCSLSAAVDLWGVKFGDGWVRVDDLPNAPQGTGEMDWLRLLTRLNAANKLEKYEDYVRIIT